MRRELVFTAHPGYATLARPISLAEAGLKERSDLQEWIRHNPTILGRGVRIVTYEFNKWVSTTGSPADRLDLLGLDESGRLVLAELKRDSAPQSVEMQAIKYAAYASKFEPETLASCHGAYLRSTGLAEVTDEDALEQLNEHCGGIDPDMLASPRIVLVAGSFAESTTAAVVWLCDQGLDISLVQIGAHQCEQDLVITVDQLWPLPSIEGFTVGPTAPTTAPRRSRSGRTTYSTAVAALAEKGALDDGTELRLSPAGPSAVGVNEWVAQAPERGTAIWRTGEKVRALEWPVDGQRYSASGLAERIITEATGATASVNGAEWWALDDGTTLAELAGMRPGKKDWSQLHSLLTHLLRGEWTSYGELAAAVASHPIAVGQHVARCPICENAWRVLGVDGRPRPNFVWTDPAETRSCRQVLEDEGVEFAATGSALPGSKVTGARLLTRLV